MASLLTQGSIRQMYENNKPNRPVVQLIDLRKLNKESEADRYRLVLSDGTHFLQGMLATQATHFVTDGSMVKHTIVSLEEYMVNEVKGKRIAIILRCSVVQQATGVIGQPMNVYELPAGGSGGAPSFSQHRAQPPPVPSASAMGGGSWGAGRSSSFNAPPAGMSGRSDNCQPITSLNPYQRGWRIKARVTSKSSVREWNKPNSSGKLFSVDLLDAMGGEIRATMFNNACDKFYQIFEKDQVYTVANGQVKMARKQFTHLKNDYELTLNEDSVVVPVGNDAAIERQRYNFVKVADVSNVPENSYVDVLAIVLTVQPCMKITSKKTGKELDKRSLVIGDDTATIELTLWNEQAVEFDETKLANRPVVALRAARVSDFGGKSLSCGASAPDVWPDRPEARELQAWFTRSGGVEGGAMNSVASLTSVGGGGIGSANAPFKSFRQVKDEEIGMHLTEEKKSEYFSAVGWITSVSHSTERPPWYMACPKEAGVNYKVTDSGDGKFYCEKNMTSYPSYQPRYIVRFQCMDYSGQQWMSGFHDICEKLLGVTCKDAEAYLNNGQMEEFNRVFTDATFKRVQFKCRAKCDRSYQDEMRVQVTAVDFAPVDPVAQSAVLLDKIRELQQQRLQQGI